MEPIRVAFIFSISLHLFLFGVSSYFVPKAKIYSVPYVVTLIHEEPKKDKKFQMEKLKKEETRKKKSSLVKNKSKKKKEESKKKIPRVTKKTTVLKVKKFKKKVKREKKDPLITNSHKVVQKAVAQIQQKEKQKSLESIRQSVENIQRKLLEQNTVAMQENQILPREQTSFYLNTYYSQVTNLINSHWLLPESGYDKGKELLTVVSIRVDKDGIIQDVKIESESGDPLLDNSILIAIKRVGRLPPLPPEISKDPIEIGLQFSPPEE